MADERHNCNGWVHDPGVFRGRGCTKRATVQDADGRWWCGTHNPEAQRRRDEESNRRSAIQTEHYEARMAAAEARGRRLAELERERGRIMGPGLMGARADWEAARARLELAVGALKAEGLAPRFGNYPAEWSVNVMVTRRPE